MKFLKILFWILMFVSNKVVQPMVIGHKGACGYAPENTCASFEKAIELDVDMIELDVHRCKSGELIVMHDKRLEITTNGFGCIAEKKLGELKKLSMGCDQSILTLEQALDCINRRTKVNIEIKEVSTAQQIVDVIKFYVRTKGWHYSDFLVSSFNHYEVLTVKDLSPEIPRGVLLSSIPVDFDDKVGAAVVIVYVDCIDRHFVEYLHAKGKLVYVYTVNYPDDIKRMISLCVDGIISDFPDRVFHYLRR